MCDPVSIGMGALMAGGSAIKGRQEQAAVNASIRARNQATKEEIARQHGYQDEASGVWDNIMGGWAPGAQAVSLATQQGNAGSALAGNAPGPFGDASISGNAPAAAMRHSSNVLGDTLATGADRDATMGNLLGYDLLNFENDMNLGAGTRGLGTISDFARTSASLSPLEQELAMENAYQQNKPGMLGDLLMTVGSIGMNASGNGMFGLGPRAPMVKTSSALLGPMRRPGLFG